VLFKYQVEHDVSDPLSGYTTAWGNVLAYCEFSARSYVNCLKDEKDKRYKRSKTRGTHEEEYNISLPIHVSLPALSSCRPWSDYGCDARYQSVNNASPNKSCGCQVEASATWASISC
jgi:hypothetical protein